MLYIGAHRYVITGGMFALKIPRIRITKFLKLVALDIKYRKRHWCTWFWFIEIVFGGLRENFREAQCYFNTRHHLLTRLYLPLLIVNIYRKEAGVGDFNFQGEELYSQVFKSGDCEFREALRPCSHTFDHTNNFAYSKNRVRILDYGEEGFENLLTKHGDKVERLLLSTVKQHI